MCYNRSRERRKKADFARMEAESMATSRTMEILERNDRIIHTPSSFAKRHLIYLQETGELHASSRHVGQRDDLHSYLFFLVLEGNGRLHYRGKEYALRPGSCVFIDCRHEYQHESLGAEWTLRWVHFCGTGAKELYDYYRQSGGRVCFSPKAFLAYSDLLGEIYRHAASEVYVSDLQLYEYLVHLMTMLCEENRTQELETETENGVRDMTPVKQYLEQHYQEKISLDLLAEQFYVNKFYMTRIFKKQFGDSIVNYLTHIRITRAKQLLRFTDLSIEKIGQECGLNDVNYFARVFRKVEGTSPGEFRKMW